MILHLEDIGQNYQVGGKRYLSQGKIPIKLENDEGAILTEFTSRACVSKKWHYIGQYSGKNGQPKHEAVKIMDSEMLNDLIIWFNAIG